ncbi:clavaminate synthase-like protein [Coleophoma crateriformis]|uniref:Clavaminate synthase-like protein n=1 Tax=Coleophoma crateriformis TaxID=565419 RepID=A0A3D8QU45_9HELO|nr:clavaminate synthase-like protein [Coleophoma crateriformis]
MSEIPVIDFSAFLDAGSVAATKHSVALEIDRACREVGFFYISNHGLDPTLLQSMLDGARTFFTTATQEQKDSIAIKKAGDGIGDLARGYQRVDGGIKGAHEAVDMFRPVDTSNGPPYEVGLGENQWPDKPKDFQRVSEQYIDALLLLATAILKAMAMALDVDETIFTSRIDKSFWNLRILKYDATNADAISPAVAGIGEHTGKIISSPPSWYPQKDSLQVLSKTGAWIPADPIPGCFIVNLGDMLSKWTNGIYVSTKHRVVHNSTQPRISIPFFFDPNMDALISPVLPLDGTDRENEGILYREMFTRAITYSVVT